MRTFGIRQTCVVHTLLISHERHANAGRTLLYAVISHDTPGIRYEYATYTLDIRSVR